MCFVSTFIDFPVRKLKGGRKVAVPRSILRTGRHCFLVISSENLASARVRVLVANLLNRTLYLFFSSNVNKNKKEKFGCHHA
jgi:hypothetical protein